VYDKGGSDREVRIGPVMLPLLAGVPRRGAHVWPSRTGARKPHVDPNTVSDWARRVFDQVEQLEGLTLHQAGRHAAADRAIALGASVASAAGQVGHKGLRTLAERYASVGDPQGARETLDGALVAPRPALRKVVG